MTMKTQSGETVIMITLSIVSVSSVQQTLTMTLIQMNPLVLKAIPMKLITQNPHRSKDDTNNPLCA